MLNNNWFAWLAAGLPGAVSEDVPADPRRRDGRRVRRRRQSLRRRPRASRDAGLRAVLPRHHEHQGQRLRTKGGAKQYNHRAFFPYNEL
eukprot:4485709-Pyramimonas_sp.AAC.1